MSSKFSTGCLVGVYPVPVDYVTRVFLLCSSLLLNPTSGGGSSFNNDDEADYYTEHDTRKRDISLNDIVHKVSLNEFIQVFTIFVNNILLLVC